MTEYEIKVTVKVTNDDPDEADRRARFIADAMEEAANALDAELEETTIEDLS